MKNSPALEPAFGVATGFSGGTVLMRATSLALAIPLLAFIGSSAIAEVHHVPGEYSTIQAALDACADADTVLIGPGAYRGPGNRDLQIHGRDIVVKSSSGAMSTIIDCEYAGRGFYWYGWIGPTDNVALEGLTVTRGAAHSGAGVYCGSSARIIDCRIIGNHASGTGGGLVISGSVLVERCEIRENMAQDGGGVEYIVGEAEFVDCLIIHNWAVDGGGVAFSGTGWRTTRFRRCTITGNAGAWSGGGLIGGDPVVMEQTILWGNCSGSGGGPEWQYCQAQFLCCDVNLSGLTGTGYTLDENCIFIDPRFCGPAPCGTSPVGDYSLHADSPCQTEHSPCGELIGALGLGCGSPTRVETTTIGRLRQLFRGR